MLPALQKKWPHAHWMEDHETAEKWAEEIFTPPRVQRDIPLLMQGSSFQIRVWQALLETTPGSILTYQDIARQTGSPAAVRAVGNALAANCIGFLIPCHRVIRSDGRLGRYAWGQDRKRRILEWEQSAVDSDTATSFRLPFFPLAQHRVNDYGVSANNGAQADREHSRDPGSGR